MAGHRLRRERIEGGLCQDCGAPRGQGGTSTQCRAHADERNAKQRVRIARVRSLRRKRNECLECGEPLGPRRRRRSTWQLCDFHREEKRKRDSKRYRLQPSLS